MHDYRRRIGLADGERKYDNLEERLAALHVVAVPAITMERDSNGAIHAPGTAFRNKFAGEYDYRLIIGDLRHNIPQEPRRPLARRSSMSTVSASRRRPCELIREAPRVPVSTTQKSAPRGLFVCALLPIPLAAANQTPALRRVAGRLRATGTNKSLAASRAPATIITKSIALATTSNAAILSKVGTTDAGIIIHLA